MNTLSWIGRCQETSEISFLKVVWTNHWSDELKHKKKICNAALLSTIKQKTRDQLHTNERQKQTGRCGHCEGHFNLKRTWESPILPLLIPPLNLQISPEGNSINSPRTKVGTHNKNNTPSMRKCGHNKKMEKIPFHF